MPTCYETPKNTAQNCVGLIKHYDRVRELDLSETDQRMLKQVAGKVRKMLTKLKYYWSKTNRWHRVLFIFLVGELGLLPAGRRGFYCNDPSLSHEFTGDTVTWKWLLASTVILPLPVMLVIERLYHFNPKRKLALRWYKEYLFGLLVNLAIVQTLKILVGAPRPHFFDTCKPLEAEMCEESEYVKSYTCTESPWLSRSNQSFPSGHTSMACHTTVFIAWYLHRRIKAHFTLLTLRAIQTTLAILALLCGVSRMTDHRHHLLDVLGGTVIALPVVIYTINYLCKDFQFADTPRKEQNVTNGSTYDSTSEPVSCTPSTKEIS